MSDRLLSVEQTRAMLAECGKSTLYRYVRAGHLPLPVKMGHKSCWPESEVLALVERLKVCRNMGQMAGQHVEGEKKAA